MNNMSNKHRRHHTHHRAKNSYNEYSPASHTDRSNNKSQTDFSDQCQPPNSKQHSRTTIPHERESWIRSVKKTTINESTEQRTQYLETILRLPQQQQKSSTDSSMFDRIRFANDHISTSTNTLENHTIDHSESSLHFIDHASDHHEICVLEEILFGNELQSATSSASSITCKPACPKNTKTQSYSAFLIDDCDEVAELPASSPPLRPPSVYPVIPVVQGTMKEDQKDANEQCGLLINELDTADAERRRGLKNRRRRSRRKIKNKKKQLEQPKEKKKKKKKKSDKQKIISSVNNNSNNHQELSSDCIHEYGASDVDQISQLTGMIQRASTTMGAENKAAEVNKILTKIKKQQRQLRKLRKYVISLLDEQKHDSTDARQNLHVNQPIIFGCWLCSGKKYSETAIQCDHVGEQE